MLTFIRRHYSPKTWVHRPLQELGRKSDGGGEKPKVLIDTSLWKALRYCTLHILPICTTLLILVINIEGVFVGADFVGPIKSETINLLLLQIAAKIHEILIVASLGLIILQMVRHELLFGDGLPLGLVGSGLTFSNFGFFFQKEFYGALSYVAKGHATRKVCFIAVLVVAGFTAALSGPASATLLVPKSQLWPIGGTPYFLNGSTDDFWPADISKESSALRPYCDTTNSTKVSICPAAGYQSLWQHWSRMNHTNFVQQDRGSYAQGVSGTHFFWPVHSADSIIPALYALGDFRKDNRLSSNTFLVQPHAAVAATLQRIGDAWWDILVGTRKMDDRIISDRQISSLYVRTPLASVRCSDPQNISTSIQSIQLPTIDGRFFYSRPSDINVTSLNKTSSKHLRFQWLPLPDKFGAASVGAVFESPWVADNQSRVVLGCTAQLGYIPTSLYTDKYTFWTGWYPWDLQFGERTPAYVGIQPGSTSPPTNGRVAVNNDWLKLLTPTAPVTNIDHQDWEPTTIESILFNAGFDDTSSLVNGSNPATSWLNDEQSGPSRTAFLEAIIASILVDGLSRTGSHKIFDKRGAPSQWPLSAYLPRPDFEKQLMANRTAFLKPEVPSDQLTTLRVSMLISGFSFRTSLAGFLALCVLLTHLVMATIHIVWILFHRHSSWSWSTVSELIALAQKSQPPVTALKNAGAGVEKAVTFAKIAKVKVRPAAREAEVDTVELVFEDDVSDGLGLGLDLEMYAGRQRTRNDSSGPASTSDSMLALPDEQRTRKSSVASTFDAVHRDSSMERLVPRAHIAGDNSKARGSVRIDQAYG